jgi:hypothetical protein
VTIILSLVTADYALQVSDRLLSLKSANQYDPWDPASNKSVILLGHDGLITMGYSGPAFISGATTDGWIAEVLSGVDLGARNSRPNFGMQIGSGVPDRFLYMHLNAIADRLNEALAAGQVDRNLDIYGVGLCSSSRKKQAWPVMARIHRDRAKCCYAPAMSKRRWGATPSSAGSPTHCAPSERDAAGWRSSLASLESVSPGWPRSCVVTLAIHRCSGWRLGASRTGRRCRTR